MLISLESKKLDATLDSPNDQETLQPEEETKLLRITRFRDRNSEQDVIDTNSNLVHVMMENMTLRLKYAGQQGS